MKDDDLLKELANAARAEDEELDDPRWARLVSGRLDERDRAALAESARRSELGELALIAFDPLDSAAKRRIEDAVMGVLVGGARPVSSLRPAPSSRRRVAFTTLLLAAALGTGLLVVGRRIGDHASPLPLYAMVIVGGDQSVRRVTVPSELAPRIGARSHIEITLRPETRSEGPIAARAFLARDGRVRTWDAPIEIDSGGAARVTGIGETLFAGVEEGPWEILFAVGPAGALPGADDVEAAIRADRAPEGFRLLRRDVILGAVAAPGASGAKGNP